MSIYEEGQNARNDDQLPEDNPYRPETDNFKKWFNGYLDVDIQLSGDYD